RRPGKGGPSRFKRGRARRKRAFVLRQRRLVMPAEIGQRKSLDRLDPRKQPHPNGAPFNLAAKRHAIQFLQETGSGGRIITKNASSMAFDFLCGRLGNFWNENTIVVYYR